MALPAPECAGEAGGGAGWWECSPNQGLGSGAGGKSLANPGRNSAGSGSGSGLGNQPGLAPYGFSHASPAETASARRLGQRAEDRRKISWVQAESMVAMLRMHILTSAKEYYDAFAGTFRFVRRQQIAPEGGWWSEVREDGSRRTHPHRTGHWQAAYHSGRALLLCAEMLEELEVKARGNGE